MIFLHFLMVRSRAFIEIILRAQLQEISRFHLEKYSTTKTKKITGKKVIESGVSKRQIFNTKVSQF
jgi:hypothetical protein